MAETFLCTHCGQEHPRSELVTFDGQQLCLRCQGTLTEICEYCGERFWARDNCGDRHTAVCADCIDNYARCCECGNLVREGDLHYLNDDDDYGYCDSCWADHGERHVIHDYYYKPEPTFYGDGNRFFGVELEMDEGGELDSKARKVLEVANADAPRAYAKHDGSLDDGFELVTEPHSLAAHEHDFPWEDTLGTAISLGYTSHMARTCGLHVHVNRTTFGTTRSEQEDAIARVLFFVENHWNELLRFSRRTNRQMDQWAARYGRKDDPKEVFHVAKNGGERHSCVNLTNATTIEFRMFRGTLKYTSLIATLQMVDRICDVAIALSDQDIQNITWSEFVSGCTAPELVQYLKERRLYVNDPVTVSEEV